MRKTINVEPIREYVKSKAEYYEEDYFDGHSIKSLSRLKAYKDVLAKIDELAGIKEKKL